MADYARILDFACIAVMVMLLNKITTRPTSGGDWIGTIFASWIIFALFKWPYLALLGGFTFPVTKDPVVHLVSAPLSVITAVMLFGIIRFVRCPHRINPDT